VLRQERRKRGREKGWDKQISDIRRGEIIPNLLIDMLTQSEVD
jgi:hypothetical protein